MTRTFLRLTTDRDKRDVPRRRRRRHFSIPRLLTRTSFGTSTCQLDCCPIGHRRHCRLRAAASGCARSCASDAVSVLATSQVGDDDDDDDKNLPDRRHDRQTEGPPTALLPLALMSCVI